MGQNQSTARYHHPTRCLHRDFYLLRLKVLINGRETEIIDNNSVPALYSDVLEHSFPLSDIARGVDNILNEHGVTLKCCHYNSTCPLFVLGLSPLLSKEEAESLLLHICNRQHQMRVSVVLKRLLSSKCSIEVDLKAYLCSPTKDSVPQSKWKVSASQVGTVDSMDSHVHKEDVLFDFYDLFKPPSDNGELLNPEPLQEPKGSSIASPDFIKVLPVLKKAADVWLPLGLLLGVPPYHLRVLEKQYDSPYDRVSDMLMWLFDNTTVTWTLVVTALWYSDKKQLARDLQQKHCFEFPHELEQQETQIVEDTRAQQNKHKLSEIKASTKSILNDTNEKSDDLSQLLKHCEELRKERQQTEQKLHLEQADCAKLRESQQSLKAALQEKNVKITVLEGEIAKISSEKEAVIKDLTVQLEDTQAEHSQRLSTVTKDLANRHLELNAQITVLEEALTKVSGDINEKEAVIKDLTVQLEDTQAEHKGCRQRLSKLTKELANKRLELKERAEVVESLESLLLQGCCVEVDQQAEQRAKSEEISLQKAREQSENAYLAELEAQLQGEEVEVEKSEEKQMQLSSKAIMLHNHITTLETRINNLEICLEELTSAHDDRNDNTEEISEKQIEIATLEIEVMKLREECAGAEIDLKRVRQDLIHRRDSIQRKKTSLKSSITAQDHKKEDTQGLHEKTESAKIEEGLKILRTSGTLVLGALPHNMNQLQWVNITNGAIVFTSMLLQSVWTRYAMVTPIRRYKSFGPFYKHLIMYPSGDKFPRLKIPKKIKKQFWKSDSLFHNDFLCARHILPKNSKSPWVRIDPFKIANVLQPKHKRPKDKDGKDKPPLKPKLRTGVSFNELQLLFYTRCCRRSARGIKNKFKIDIEIKLETKAPVDTFQSLIGRYIKKQVAAVVGNDHYDTIYKKSVTVELPHGTHPKAYCRLITYKPEKSILRQQPVFVSVSIKPRPEGTCWVEDTHLFVRFSGYDSTCEKLK